MSSILITGSNRGLGLEFVKQLLAHATPPSILIATCRKPDEAQELQTLAKKHSNLHILKLDVLDFDGFEGFALQVKDIVGDKGLNVLINNAGILRGRKSSFSQVDAKDMTDVYITNTVAPLLLTRALLPRLREAAEFKKDLPMGWNRAAIINISSQLGSIGGNDMGGFWEYRESKAALNMSARSLAIELLPQNILILSMHPGWVQTDMGTQEAPLKPKESISGMLRVLYGLEPKHHDKFYQWDGKEVPW